MAQRHQIDVPDVDLVAAAEAVHQLSDAVARRAIEIAKEATYISVGLGLLAFQRAQVRRREFERSIRS